jgi:GWxTD domain-containing protein
MSLHAPGPAAILCRTGSVERRGPWPARRRRRAVLREFHIACLAAAACGALAAPAVGQGDFNRPVRESAFELSISQEFGDSLKPTIAVNASIPYRRLVFFVRGQRYEARYRVYLELRDTHGRRVRGEVWEESVSTGSFRETTSSALAASSQRVFSVSPGSYRAVVTIEVVDTSRRFSEEQSVRVVEGGGGKLEISTPVFRTHPGDSLTERPRDGEISISICPPSAAESTRINPGAVYGDFAGWARIVYNLETPSTGETAPLVLTARIRDARGIVVRYARKGFDRIEGGRAQLCIDLNIDNLRIGSYEIDVVAGTVDGSQRSHSQGGYTVLFNKGLLGEHIGDLVELLSLVADEKEARLIEEAPPAKRVDAWTAFWRRRDPSRSTESNEAFGEFLQRLRYVLSSFSKHQPGWRTDMGRTYLKNGSPDRVEDRQDSRLGRSYVLWYYNSKGIVYIFEDAIGTGEYRLVTTEVI